MREHGRPAGRSSSLAAVLWGVLHLVPLAAAEPVTLQVRSIDAGTLTLTEAVFADRWQVTGKRDGEPVTLRGRDLLEISFQPQVTPPAPSGAQVVFASGEVLAGKIQSSDLDHVRVFNFTLSLVPITVPLGSVAGLILDETLPRPAARRWRERLLEVAQQPNPPAGDTVWLANGDQLVGTLLEIDGEQIRFDHGGNVVNLARNTVPAVAFDPALSDYEPPSDLFAILRFAEGSEIHVADLVGEKGSLTAKTVFGASIRLEAADLVDLAFRNGRARYLSDLEPADVQMNLFFDDRWNYQRDLSALGTPLTLHRRVYRKGLGVLAGTSITYEVSGGERLEGVLGLDRLAGPLASVRCQVAVDGQEVFVSEVLTAASPPVPLRLELPERSADAPHRITLTVEPATRGNVQDFTNWVDLRIIQRSQDP